MMPSTEIMNIRNREGLTDVTLLSVLLDWIDNQDEEARERAVRYVENRARGESDDEERGA